MFAPALNNVLIESTRSLYKT